MQSKVRDSQRAEDRRELQTYFDHLNEAHVAVVAEQHRRTNEILEKSFSDLLRTLLTESEGTSEYYARLHSEHMDKLSELSVKLDRLYEVMAIPPGDNPSLAEQINVAMSDDAVKDELRTLLAEAEFENPDLV